MVVFWSQTTSIFEAKPPQLHNVDFGVRAF
jgi:hypothetical protein